VAALNTDKRYRQLFSWERLINLDVYRACNIITCRKPNVVFICVDVKNASCKDVQGFVPKIAAFSIVITSAFYASATRQFAILSKI
jgi:hypothetical protein